MINFIIDASRTEAYYYLYPLTSLLDARNIEYCVYNICNKTTSDIYNLYKIQYVEGFIQDFYDSRVVFILRDLCDLWFEIYNNRKKLNYKTFRIFMGLGNGTIVNKHTDKIELLGDMSFIFGQSSFDSMLSNIPAIELEKITKIVGSIKLEYIRNNSSEEIKDGGVAVLLTGNDAINNEIVNFTSKYFLEEHITFFSHPFEDAVVFIPKEKFKDFSYVSGGIKNQIGNYNRIIFDSRSSAIFECLLKNKTFNLVWPHSLKNPQLKFISERKVNFEGGEYSECKKEDMSEEFIKYHITSLEENSSEQIIKEII